MSDPHPDHHPSPVPRRRWQIYWLDDKTNRAKILWVLVAVCAGLIIADLFITSMSSTTLKIGSDFMDYSDFSAVVLVLLAQALRKILMRDEDYYDH